MFVDNLTYHLINIEIKYAEMNELLRQLKEVNVIVLDRYDHTNNLY